MTSSPTDTVVIGIGNPMRGDDGIGPVAIDRLDRTWHGASRPQLVVLDGEPTRLIDIWRRCDRAIVIDGAITGRAPGSIHRIEVGIDADPPTRPGASSHRAGLADAVALARALDALPRRLVILGIEVADVSLGHPLSPPVEAALPGLVARVVDEVGA